VVTANNESKIQEQLLVENNELRWQLKEANSIISTIREGNAKSKERSRELQDINTTLEYEATERQAAQEAMQDLNTRLEEEATKRQAAQEALTALSTISVARWSISRVSPVKWGHHFSKCGNFFVTSR
jgi:nitrogen fixation protein FixH